MEPNALCNKADIAGSYTGLSITPSRDLIETIARQCGYSGFRVQGPGFGVQGFLLTVFSLGLRNPAEPQSLSLVCVCVLYLAVET